MPAIVLVIASALFFWWGYRFYSRRLAARVFELDDGNRTPACEFNDGMDYVPTKSSVVFGHHFTSIAGVGPIVGPAVGVVWGWLPAFLWVTLGSVFAGAVHDFGSLVLSARHKGRSVGDLSGAIMGGRARSIFLLLIFFLLLIVLAVFALVIALIFENKPETVFPCIVGTLLAFVVGTYVRRGGSIAAATVVSAALLFASIWLSARYTFFDLTLPAFVPQEYRVLTWIALTLGYTFVAAVLPVWLLLQPRDYINSSVLYVGMAAMYLGLILSMRPIVAPAVRLDVEGAPWLVPFLFITIACGAISGFHSLVASGTTVKQVDSECHCRTIGYGAMLVEGALAVIVILACTAGFDSSEAWYVFYGSWIGEKGLFDKLGGFINGSASFLNVVGVPTAVATAFISVMIVNFALTTADSCARLQRYIVAEIGDTFRLPVLSNRLVASAVAVLTAVGLCLSSGKGGAGGMFLWPIFGTANQMLAALALLVVTLWLYQRRKPTLYTAIPMVFMFVMTLIGMFYNLAVCLHDPDGPGPRQPEYVLFVISLALVILAVWLAVEGVGTYRNGRTAPAAAVPERA